MIGNKPPMVVPAGDNGICPDTFRYYTLIYVAIKGTDFFVSVSCKDFNLGTFESDDMVFEFLKYNDMSNFTFPYDAELFSEIEDVAKLQLKELKEEEPISGAV
jgi:hypothetical protein